MTFTNDYIEIGDRYGRLVVREAAGTHYSGGRLWLCDCDCGTQKTTQARHLRSGCTQSCGCLQRERAAEARKKSVIHGLSATPEWRAWAAMKQRCGNPNSRHWKNYGGRGIKVCVRWRRSFAAFYKDVGPRPSAKHSLGRIENDEGYEPGNVEWQTTSQQAVNRRRPRRPLRPRKRYPSRRLMGPTWWWRGIERPTDGPLVDDES